MRSLGRLAAVVRRDERQVARRQLAAAFPRWSASRVEKTSRTCFVEFGENLLDSVRGDRRIQAQDDDLRQLRAWVADPRPLMLLTAHLGAWELLGRWLAEVAGPLGVVTADPHNHRVDAWLRRQRQQYGLTTFDRRRQPLAAARWLRQGRTLAVLADLRSSVASVEAPWFGQPAPTAIGPGRLARRTQARLVSVGSWREGRSHKVVLGPPIEWSEDMGDRELAARCNRALEQLILQAPQQWPWFHDRCGRREGGSR
jgi:KDO2-lipid IV(A) lauroyltransferase